MNSQSLDSLILASADLHPAFWGQLLATCSSWPRKSEGAPGRFPKDVDLFPIYQIIIGCEETRVASFRFQIYLPSLLAKATCESGLHILTAPWNFFQEMDGHAMDISMNPERTAAGGEVGKHRQRLWRSSRDLENFPVDLG